MIPTWLVRLVLALMVLLVAWYGSKLVVRLLSRRVARRFRRPSVVQSVLGSIRSVIMLAAVFVALGVAGVLRISDLVLSATVLTAATVLVLTPIIGSIVNGLLILADQPYEIGDMIEFVDSANRNQTGQRGFVEDITLRYTKIFTLDNTFMVVPNATMRDRDVINYSAEDPRTRLRLDVLVTYEGDLAEARTLIERAARKVEVVVSGGPDIRIGSARYPAAPTCYINEFADHGVLLTLRYWAREPYKLLTVRSAVQENVWEALDDADVEMAYPHSHLVFDETSGTLPISLDERAGGAGDDERRRFGDGERTGSGPGFEPEPEPEPESGHGTDSGTTTEATTEGETGSGSGAGADGRTPDDR
ncbi:mechanosensitive ion channel family protein [Halobacteriales archaeon QS_8_65_32]|nr:MAG: mechanosensitive ion channel family protein [Halobacteriales archaeon QS_8_65_32]